MQRDNEIIGEVTFVLNNGQKDIVKDIEAAYTPNGWKIGDTHYDSLETITVLDDCEVVPDYIVNVYETIFPNTPTREGYNFKGWYKAAHGGDPISSYHGSESIYIYAQWTQADPDAEEYILPNDQAEKPIETIATVTFKFHNGNPDAYGYVQKKYIAKGWLVDGVYHNNGDIILKGENTVIEPNYNEVIMPAEYPKAPTNGNSRYVGWYTEETGGQRVFNYKELQDITLHAHYTDNYTIFTNRAGQDAAYGDYFERATEEQYQNAVANNLSMRNLAAGSNYPAIYNWVDNKHSYFYSEADVIYLGNSASYMFFNTNFKYIDLSEVETCYTTDMSYLFWNAEYLISLDLSNFDTSNVTTMRYMISTDSKYLTSLDISTFNTTKVTDMSSLFSGNSNLTSLDISNLDTRKVVELNSVFYALRNLTELDLSNFDTSNVVYMMQLFGRMEKIKSLDLSNFNTKKTEYITAMFQDCYELEEVNLSSFDTSKVVYFTDLFARCRSLKEIDISSFSANRVTAIQRMFTDCENLKTVYVSDLWDYRTISYSGINGTGMFTNDYNIVGQRGTTYDSNNISKVYAKVDGGPEDPGYFTNKYAVSFTISLPDGTTERVREGDEYTIPTNNYPKDDEALAIITFNPQNGESAITSTAYKKFTPNGFYIGDTLYNAGDVIRVTGDITLVPNYDEEIIAATFPDDPTKEDVIFTGWYTEETDGDKVESLEGIVTDTILYAQYTDAVTITTPTEEIVITKGDEYTLPTNNETKDNTIASTVTFVYENGNDNTTSNVIKTYLASGWLIDGVHYEDGATITVNNNITLVPDFTVTILPAEFPEDPTRDHYEFDGWFDGEQKYESYSGEQDITLTAKWKATLPTSISLDADSINIVKGLTHQIVVNKDPEESVCDFLYTGYDDIISIDEQGLITAISAGTTTVTITVDGDVNVNTTLTVNVLSDEITSL